jgi:hypothetical protein
MVGYRLNGGRPQTFVQELPYSSIRYDTDARELGYFARESLMAVLYQIGDIC